MTFYWPVLLTPVLLAITVWGSGALCYRGPAGRPTRITLMALWAAAGLGATVATWAPGAPWRLDAQLAFVFLCALLGAWWRSIRPLQHRDWSADVARLLKPEIVGDRVTLHNVRNFIWRTREDFTPRWETRCYDLGQLRSVDLIVSYWMGPAIAHALASFGFADGQHLVFSVEVRRTRGQEFSALGGFFKQSERILVAADERDIVRTRSNVRGEDVYIYRVALPLAELQALFRAYLREAQRLCEKPAFYHTLFSNCTTLVFTMVKRIVPGLPHDRRLLISGYLPNYLYDLDALDTSRPFLELRARGYINPRAIASDIDGQASDDFSPAIRRGVPAPDGSLILSEADTSETTA